MGSTKWSRKEAFSTVNEVAWQGALARVAEGATRAPRRRAFGIVRGEATREAPKVPSKRAPEMRLDHVPDPSKTIPSDQNTRKGSAWKLLGPSMHPALEPPDE